MSSVNSHFWVGVIISHGLLQITWHTSQTHSATTLEPSQPANQIVSVQGGLGEAARKWAG